MISSSSTHFDHSGDRRQLRRAEQVLLQAGAALHVVARLQGRGEVLHEGQHAQAGDQKIFRIG